MINRRNLLQAAGGLTAAACGLPAHANPGPVSLIVGFPPGGGPDTIARIVADHVRQQGTQILVDNKTGAGGRIAMEFVKRAAPDGKTLVWTPGSMLGIYPHVYNRLGYGRDDFTPIAKLAAYSLALVVPVESKHASLQDLLQWCARHPSQATCGLPGLGNDANIVAWKLGKSANLQFELVPYQGGPQLTQGLLSGTIAFAINVTSNFTELHRAGKVRMLAVSSAVRVPRVPDVPTFAELGLQGCLSEEWLGVLGPRGLAPGVVKSLAASFLAAGTDPAVQKLIRERDHIPQAEDTARFTRTIAESYAQRAEEIAQAGIPKMD